MDPKSRASIALGAHVEVVTKPDQSTGRLTPGVVEAVLTNSGFHPHGIKVRLKGGVVGRVKNIIAI